MRFILSVVLERTVRVLNTVDVVIEEYFSLSVIQKRKGNNVNKA